MSLDFVQNFEAVGRGIHRRQLAAAACWTLAGVTATGLVLAAADRWLGVYHLAARILLTVLLVAAALAILCRAAASVRRRKSPLEVALLLEKDEPELRSLLASGVEFTSQDPGDVTAGSTELRRGVVLRAALASERVDLSTAAARRAPLRKAIAAAVVAVTAVAAATVWAPKGVAIGVARLVNPFTQVEWPRRHDLAFVDPPQVVALGDDFRVQLHDRHGAMPATVVVEYRTTRQGRWHYDSQRYAPDGSSLDIVWPNVRGPFEFRAIGGDHRSMPWRRVATATAPQVENVRIAVHAPAYTGRPERALEEPFRVLKGSTLQLAARTTEPVASGQLEAKGQPPIPLVVSGAGRSISLASGEWRPATTAEWSFRLTTPGGLTTGGTRPMRVEVTPDVAPTASIVKPADELFLLPMARIELTIEASDDVGLSEVDLAVGEVDAPAARSNRIETELFRAALAGDGPQPTIETVAQHALAFSTLDARPGSAWEIRAVARDLAGHEFHSQPPLRVRVITLEQFMSRVERELARVRAALESAYDHQRDALGRVDSWSPDDSTMQWPIRDQALAALAQQRQTARPLAEGQNAALAVLEALLIDYRRNGLAADDDLPRLERLHAALDALALESLPAVESLLAQFVRDLELVDRTDTGISAMARQLKDIEDQQQEILAVLESALNDLARWSELQPYRREIAALKAEQAAMRKDSEALALAKLQNVHRPSNATEDNRRTAAIASAQRELAARVANVLSRMQQSLAGLVEAQPADSARLAAALEAAEAAALRLTASAAADHLAAAKFGQAIDAQRDVERGLQEVLDRLAGGDSRRAAQRLAELGKAEQQVESLRQQVEALAKSQEAADREREAQQSELRRIQQERNDIAESVRKATERLQQMHVSAAAELAQRAAQNLSRPDSSATADRRAANDLQQARQALAEERRQQQALLAQLQMQRLEAALHTLVSDQQEVVHDLAQQASDAADVAEAASRQAAVRADTNREADRLESVPVFARSLRAAANAMQEAEGALTEGSAEDSALRPASRALDQLRLLADAVRQQQQAQPPPGSPPSQSPPPGGATPQNQAQNAAQARMLQLAIAQLTILRKMQADLEMQTAELERSFAAGELDQADLATQSDRLAAEQRELADLAASVVRDAELPSVNEEDELP